MGALYAQLATELGWTYAIIDDLTMIDVEDLFDYWSDNPPLTLMVGAYLGVRKEKPKRATKADLLALAQQFGGT